MANENASESIAVLGSVDPISQGVGSVNSNAVDLSLYERARFLLSLGVMAGGSTVDMVVKSGVDGVTFPNTVASITQLTQAGGDSGEKAIIDVQAEKLTAGDQFVRAEVTVAVAASLLTVVGDGLSPRYHPASDNDLSTVKEIVVA